MHCPMWLELLLRLLPLIPRLKTDVADAIAELRSDDDVETKVADLLTELEGLAADLRAAFPSIAVKKEN